MAIKLTKQEKVIRTLLKGPATLPQIVARCGFPSETAATGAIAYLRRYPHYYTITAVPRSEGRRQYVLD